MKTKINVTYDVINDIFVYFEGKYISLLDFLDYMLSNEIELKKGMGVTIEVGDRYYGFSLKQKHGGYDDVLDNKLFNEIYEWLEDIGWK
jgi:hypothetical protein